MVEIQSDVLRLEVLCDPRAPAVVRGALRSRLGDDHWVLGDAMLVASELVTNAVLHSGCSEHELVEVRVTVADGCVRIVVRDPGASSGQAHARSDPAFGGWGLQIVEHLTGRWGTERGEGYSVWAELALPPDV